MRSRNEDEMMTDLVSFIIGTFVVSSGATAPFGLSTVN